MKISYIISFPLNSDKKFCRAGNFSAITRGRASSEDINRALNLFEIPLSRSNSFSGIDFLKRLLCKFILPFLVIGFVSGIFRHWKSEVIFKVFQAYCFISIGYLSYDITQQIQRVRNDWELIIKTIQPGYLKRGLRWRIPEETVDRVELIKEYYDVERHDDLEVLVDNGCEPPQSVVQDILTAFSS